MKFSIGLFCSYCKWISIVLLSLLMIGCTSGGASRKSMNERISIMYATVVKVDEVQLKSEAGKSAAIGGLWGLAARSSGNRKDMVGGALIGAALLGGTTKIAEGSNKAYAYVLKGANQEEFKVMTEQAGIQIDDCVAVESGIHTNLRRVSYVYCQQASDNQAIEQSLHREVQEDANECQQAKQELLQSSNEDLDAWIRKVKAFCDD